MANACIAYTNLADAGSVTALTNELLLPPSNLLNPHVARKWRGPGTGNSFIVDFGSSVSIDTLAVFGITGDAINFKLSSVDPTGVAGNIYNSGTLGVDQRYLSSIRVLPSPVSARYLRVDLGNSVGTYCEAGRVFAGVRTQFTYNFGKNWSRAWNDRSTRSKTRGGQTQVFADNMFRVLDLSFDFINKTDRDGFVETIDYVNGTKTDVLFITDPASTNLARDSVWGLMSSITPVVQASVGTFTKQYTIEERL